MKAVTLFVIFAVLAVCVSVSLAQTEGQMCKALGLPVPGTKCATECQVAAAPLASCTAPLKCCLLGRNADE